MELVQEVYEKLKERDMVWPEYAVVVVKDSDGEIKFSSIGKYDIAPTVNGIYMRGEHCMFNNNIVKDIRIGLGESEHPEIVTRSEYESYYFMRESA